MKLWAVSKLAVVSAKNRIIDHIRQTPVAIFATLLGLGIIVLTLRMTYFRAETILSDLVIQNPEFLNAIIGSSATLIVVASLCGGVFIERFVGFRSRLQRLLVPAPIQSTAVLFGELLPYAIIAMMFVNLAASPLLFAIAKITRTSSTVMIGWSIVLILSGLASLTGVQISRGYWMLLRRVLPSWSRGRLTVAWAFPLGVSFLTLLWTLVTRHTEVVSSPWNPVTLLTTTHGTLFTATKPAISTTTMIAVVAIGSWVLSRLRDIPYAGDQGSWFRFQLPFKREMGRLPALVVLEVGRVVRDGSTFGQLIGVAIVLIGGAYVLRASPLGNALYPLYAQLTSYCLALLAGLLALASRGRDRNVLWLVHALPLNLYEYTTGKVLGVICSAMGIMGSYILLVRSLSPINPFGLGEWIAFWVLALASGFVLGHVWYYDSGQPTAGVMALALLFVITLLLSTGITEWVVPLMTTTGSGVGELFIAALVAIAAPLVAALIERWRWHCDLQ